MGRPLNPLNPKNNRAKPLRLRAVQKGTPRHLDLRGLSRLDYRTKEDKAAKVFRQQLIEYLGGDPNVVEKALVDRCVYLQLKCWLLDRKIVNGMDTDYDSKQYLAWSACLQRSLVRLGYKESIEIMRRRAEQQLLRAYKK